MYNYLNDKEMDLLTIENKIKEIEQELDNRRDMINLTWNGEYIQTMSDQHIANCLVKQLNYQQVTTDLKDKGCKIDVTFEGKSYDEWLSIFAAELKERDARVKLMGTLDKLYRLQSLASDEEKRSKLIDQLNEELA